ncbi:Gfo/Idh/MocA family protein [Microcella alkaliphila]|uniref:Oxidoreductase domain protein n=1 Tax=Microcella alkaliphila TaxID=279828 RepID=A0A0U5BS68_9MICO|nr:Gfo/Idh/MocA family oxidoreductase [Microcella alkaliphila]BAU31197.1 oxidoreductase domain protein [Microcella alkaliphila]
MTVTVAATDLSASPESVLRVGVVGLGMGSVHVEAFQSLPGVRVTALAGKEVERRHQLGSQYGITTLLDDWSDLVERSDIDIVSIAAPNALHHPIAMAALAAGKHVFCEKPLAINTEEARAMVDAAITHDRVLDVAFNHRRRADVQYAKAYLDEVGIGRVYHTRASWKRRAGIPGLRSWFTSKRMAGGGALIDLGPHILDSMLYLLGERLVVAVSAVTHGELGRAGYGAMDRTEQMASDSGTFDVEDLASALLRFDDGSSATLEITWASHAVDDEDITIELLGVDGGLRLFVPRYASDGTLTIYRELAGRPVAIAPDVHVPGGEHPLVIAEFIEHVRSGEWDQRRGQFALHRTEVLDACYRSAVEGREIRLEA